MTGEARRVAQPSIDLLNERIDTQFRQFNEHRAETAANFVSINTSLRALDTKLDTQAANMAERGKVNWLALGGFVLGAIGTSVTIMTVLGGLAKAPIDDRIARLTTDVETQKTIVVPRAEIEKIDAITEQRQGLLRDALRDLRKETVGKEELKMQLDWLNNAGEKRSLANREKIEKVEDRLDEFDKFVVRRQEHEQHWQNVDQQLADKQRQIDEVKRQFEGLYPASTLLKDLNERLHTVELQTLRGGAMHP